MNTFGDEQLAVDLLADKILFEALKFSVGPRTLYLSQVYILSPLCYLLQLQDDAILLTSIPSCRASASMLAQRRSPSPWTWKVSALQLPAPSQACSPTQYSPPLCHRASCPACSLCRRALVLASDTNDHGYMTCTSRMLRLHVFALPASGGDKIPAVQAPLAQQYT